MHRRVVRPVPVAPQTGPGKGDDQGATEDCGLQRRPEPPRRGATDHPDGPEHHRYQQEIVQNQPTREPATGGERAWPSRLGGLRPWDSASWA